MQDFFFSYFWLIAFVVLIIIETMTYNLVTIWFALACIPLMFFDGTCVALPAFNFCVAFDFALAFDTPPRSQKAKTKKRSEQACR